MRCQVPFNSDSCCSKQFSSQRQSQNTHQCSRSPQHRRSRSKERPNYCPCHHNNRQDQDFSYSTNPKAHPVCAICLSTHAHNVYACKTPWTWDGQHATSSRRHRGDLGIVLLSISLTQIECNWGTYHSIMQVLLTSTASSTHFLG